MKKYTNGSTIRLSGANHPPPRHLQKSTMVPRIPQSPVDSSLIIRKIKVLLDLI